jgi:hypothetical protein
LIKTKVFSKLPLFPLTSINAKARNPLNAKTKNNPPGMARGIVSN